MPDLIYHDLAKRLMEDGQPVLTLALGTRPQDLREYDFCMIEAALREEQSTLKVHRAYVADLLATP